MKKALANGNSRRKVRAALVIIASVALFGGLVVTSAQQNSQANQQQRPRRVGSDAKTPQTTSAGTPSTPTSEGEEVGDGDVVRVETQLVSVPAVVTDSTGHPLVNLRAENFVLYEDGRPQRISNFSTTEAPFEVALLLDTSGSTRDELGLIRRAARAFIDALRPGDRVAIVAFNSTSDDANGLATVDVLSKLTNDHDALQAALEKMGASNGTPYYDALMKISEDVFRNPPREELRGRRAIVALTDGVDSTSGSEFGDVRARLERTGVACYFIQVNTEDFVEDRLLQDCQQYGTLRLSKTQLERYRRIFIPRADAASFDDYCRMGPFERMQINRTLYALARREMNDLAQSSGGKAFPVNDLRDARSAFAQVANEIGTQYSLGYYPTNKAHDGRFRAIKVEVKGVNGGGTQVRAREGYYAPKG